MDKWDQKIILGFTPQGMVVSWCQSYTIFQRDLDPDKYLI